MFGASLYLKEIDMKKAQVNKNISTIKNIQKRLSGDLTPEENAAIEQLVRHYSLSFHFIQSLRLAIKLVFQIVKCLLFLC